MARPIALILVAALAAGCDGDSAPLTEVPVLDENAAPAAEATAILRKAARLLEAGAPDDAEPLLRRVLEEDPLHADARALLIDLLLDERRHDEAVVLLGEAIAADEKDIAAHELLARSTFAMGDFRAAAKAHRAWLRVDGKNSDALYGWGRVLYQQGRFEEALQAFEKAEARRSGRADVRSELGLALQALGRLEEAEEKQRDALERDPRLAEAWFRLGDVISKRDDGRADAAIEAMRTAVRQERSHVHAQLYLYRLLRLSPTADSVERVAETDRRWRSVLAIHGRQQIRRRAGAPASRGGAEEEERLLALLDADPADLAARRALAEWLHGEGHTDEAVAAYEQVLSASRDTALCYQAGLANLFEGDAARAVELLTVVVAAPDPHPAAERYLAWALLVADRPEDALAAAARAIEARPDDHLARTCHGLASMRAGDLDGGLNEIAEAGWLR